MWMLASIPPASEAGNTVEGKLPYKQVNFSGTSPR